jgi:hypothetical protein
VRHGARVGEREARGGVTVAARDVRDVRDEALDRALTAASDELGLQPWYRDCVRPLLRMERTRWPRCCGGNCEPCNALLVAVAERVLETWSPSD